MEKICEQEKFEDVQVDKGQILLDTDKFITGVAVVWYDLPNLVRGCAYTGFPGFSLQALISSTDLNGLGEEARDMVGSWESES
ncbi:MAG: hypothetical protein Q9222_006161 [Ikaeria aurantiellina]